MSLTIGQGNTLFYFSSSVDIAHGWLSVSTLTGTKYVHPYTPSVIASHPFNRVCLVTIQAKRPPHLHPPAPKMAWYSVITVDTTTILAKLGSEILRKTNQCVNTSGHSSSWKKGAKRTS